MVCYKGCLYPLYIVFFPKYFYSHEPKQDEKGIWILYAGIHDWGFRIEQRGHQYTEGVVKATEHWLHRGNWSNK